MALIPVYFLTMMVHSGMPEISLARKTFMKVIMEFLAKTAMEFTPSTPQEEAGIALVQDDRFHYLMTVRKKEGESFLQLWKTEKGNRTLVKEEALKDGKVTNSSRIYLSVQGHTEGYTFYYGYTEQEMIPFVSNMYASSNHTESENHADFDWFSYQGE